MLVLPASRLVFGMVILLLFVARHVHGQPLAGLRVVRRVLVPVVDVASVFLAGGLV